MIETAGRSSPRQRAPRGGEPGRSSSGSHFRAFCPVNTWQPSINIYRLPDRIDVCVDLAGVDPGSMTVRVEMGRLIIAGDRRAPQPAAGSDGSMCIMAMEIDHGPFCRTVSLSKDVDHTGVSVQYLKGLLWVRLPIPAEGLNR